jgi:hypothetical protein
MKNRNRGIRHEAMPDELAASNRPPSKKNYAGAGTGCGVAKSLDTP